MCKVFKEQDTQAPGWGLEYLGITRQEYQLHHPLREGMMQLLSRMQARGMQGDHPLGEQMIPLVLSNQATDANSLPPLAPVDHTEQIPVIQLEMAFPIDEKQIRHLEESLGSPLPESYKSFMLPNNGGEIELADLDWELHPIRDTTDRKRIARTTSHVLVENQSYAEWDNAAPDTLSIGDDGCGNRIVLQKLDGKYQDEIFVWDHETGELTKLADSISEATRF